MPATSPHPLQMEMEHLGEADGCFVLCCFVFFKHTRVNSFKTSSLQREFKPLCTLWSMWALPVKITLAAPIKPVTASPNSDLVSLGGMTDLFLNIYTLLPFQVRSLSV